MSFLLDTDTCSAHLKNPVVLTGRLLQYMGRLNISAVTLGELSTWAARAKASPKKIQSLRDLLDELKILPFDEDVAWKFGELRGQMLDAGRPAPSLDLLIASTAIVHNLTLVTHNVKDFAQVPGLTWVDWLAS